MAGQARIKIQWCIKAFSSCSAFKLQIIAYPVPNVHRNFKPDQVDDRSREISSSIRLSHVIPCHPMSSHVISSFWVYQSRASHHFQLLPRSHVAQGSTEGVERETEEEVEKGAIDWSKDHDMLGKLRWYAGKMRVYGKWLFYMGNKYIYICICIYVQGFIWIMMVNEWDQLTGSTDWLDTNQYLNLNCDFNGKISPNQLKNVFFCQVSKIQHVNNTLGWLVHLLGLIHRAIFEGSTIMWV